MWTKEKQAKYCKAYYEKHIKNNPEAVAKRAKYHAKWRLKNRDKWNAYSKEYYTRKATTPDEVIADLKRKLEEVERNIARYSDEIKAITAEYARFKFDVEQLLNWAYKAEDNLGGTCETEEQRRLHLYGRNLCETLKIDLQKIERKYTE